MTGKETGALPCRPDELSPSDRADRTLRAAFLILILTQDRWTEAPLKRQVRISCARVEGNLDLENAVIEPAFHLQSSHVLDFADLEGARFERNLSFQGTRFASKLNADRLKVGGNLLLHAGAEFDRVDLIGASVEGDLDANGSRFAGALRGQGLSVDGSVSLKKTEFTAPVNLSKSSVGVSLDATQAKFFQKLDLQSVSVGNDLFLRGDALLHDVDLVGTSVGAHIQLAGATIHGTLDLSRSRAGELLLYRPHLPSLDRFESSYENPIWGNDSRLILRNATVDTMQAQMRSWHFNGCAGLACSWIPADLNGLTYRRLEGFRANGKITLLDQEATRLVDWLRGVSASFGGTVRDTGYNPQPFEQLATALDQAGMQGKAREIRYAKYIYRDEVQNDAWYREYFLDPLARYSVGYGVYPFWALLWWVGLVLVGFAVSHASRNAAIRARHRKFWYSLERALPLIELSQTNRRIRHRNRWIDSYFNFHTVGGFVLATLLVGALSFLPG